MTDDVAVCPNCGSSRVRNRNPKSGRTRGDGHNYYCDECYEGFDEHDERPPQAPQTTQGLAHELEQMDPSEVGG